MYYHFFGAWTSILDFFDINFSSNRKVHVILEQVNDPMFFQYFGERNRIFVVRSILYSRIS